MEYRCPRCESVNVVIDDNGGYCRSCEYESIQTTEFMVKEDTKP